MASKRGSPDKTPVTANDEAVRTRAYELYEQRLRDAVVGDAASDWMAAQQELTPAEPAAKNNKRQ